MTTKSWIRSTLVLAAARRRRCGRVRRLRRRQLVSVRTCSRSRRPSTGRMARSIHASYDVVERHHIRVAAPAAVTLPPRVNRTSCGRRSFTQSSRRGSWSSARHRTNVRSRGACLRPCWRSVGASSRRCQTGRSSLERSPNRGSRRHVPGAAGRRFRGLLAAWLRQDRMDAAGRSDRRRPSIFRTETRAVATDATARARSVAIGRSPPRGSR